jgi:hypothetical protein
VDPYSGQPMSNPHPPTIFLRLVLILSSYLHLGLGRAIAQAVSRRLPTAVIRVRSPVKSCGICGGQSGTGAGFLQVLRFLLPFLIPSTTPHSSSIFRGWYNRPISVSPYSTKKKTLRLGLPTSPLPSAFRAKILCTFPGMSVT